MDVAKSTSLGELTDRIVEVFFPEGHAPLMNINLADSDVYLASFSGVKLNPEIRRDDGQNVTFNLGVYLEEQKSSPVRIYLHTARVTAVCIPTLEFAGKKGENRLLVPGTIFGRMSYCVIDTLVFDCNKWPKNIP